MLLPPLTAWLVTFLVHSTLLSALGLLGARLLSRPAARVVVLRGALLGGLFTATLAGLWTSGPAVTLASLDTSGRAGVISIAAPVGGTLAAPEFGQLSPPERAVVAREADLPWSRWALTGLPLVLLAFGAFGVSRLLLRERRARAALRSRRPLDLQVLPADVRGLLERSSVTRHARLSTSGGVSVPLAFGRSEVILPERALAELPPDELEALVAHELAHLERRDPLWLGAARVVAALTWFQPLSHVLVRRLADETELAADAHAVARTQRPLSLARCLERVGQWLVEEPAPAMAATMGRAGGPLLRRVRQLTADGANGLAGTRAVALATLGTLAVFACAGPSVLAPGADAREREVAEFANRYTERRDQVLVLELEEASEGGPRVTARIEGPGAHAMQLVLADEAELRDLLGRIVEHDPHVNVVVESKTELAPMNVAEVVEQVVLAGFTSIDLSGPPGMVPQRFEAKTTDELIRLLNQSAASLSERKAASTGERQVLDFGIEIDPRAKATPEVLEQFRALGYLEVPPQGAEQAVPLSGVVLRGTVGEFAIARTAIANDHELILLDAQEVESLRPAPPRNAEGLAVSMRFERERVSSIEARYIVRLNAAGRVEFSHWYRVYTRSTGSMREPLERLAAEMRRGQVPEGSLTRGLCTDRLQIRAQPETPTFAIKMLMEFCGSQGVQIRKIELAAADGTDVVEVFLPTDLDVEPVEEEWAEAEILGEGDERPAQPEVRIDASGGRATYGIGPRSFDDASQAVAALELLLRGQPEGSPRSVTIDARPGVVYAEVAALLEALRGKQVRVLFVGAYDSERAAAGVR